MQMSIEDAAAVLGTTTESSRDEIRSAFRRQARKVHPDINSVGANSQSGAAGTFTQLNDARVILETEYSRRVGEGRPRDSSAQRKAFLTSHLSSESLATQKNVVDRPRWVRWTISIGGICFAAGTCVTVLSIWLKAA